MIRQWAKIIVWCGSAATQRYMRWSLILALAALPPSNLCRYGGPLCAGRKNRQLRAEGFLHDSDIELIPVSMAGPEPVFVIVSGRTDDLATGMFSAWRFDGHRALLLWSSDLLQQSSYEIAPDGFRLTYCAESNEDHPEQCSKMKRDLYRYQGGEWK